MTNLHNFQAETTSAALPCHAERTTLRAVFLSRCCEQIRGTNASRDAGRITYAVSKPV